MNSYNEKVIKDALNLRRSDTDEKFLKEIEEANNNPKFKTNKREAKRFVKEIYAKKNHRPLLRAASIILVAVASLVVVTMNVEGFSEKITTFFAGFFNPDFATIEINKNNNEFADYKGMYVPSVIPKGYEIKSITKGKNSCSIVLTNQDNFMIVLKESDQSVRTNIDTENVDEIKEVEINGMTGLYVKKDDLETLLLNTGEIMIQICDDNPEVNLIGFAELIEKR